MWSVGINSTSFRYLGGLKKRLHPLDNGFDYPVGVSQSVEVVLEISQADPVGDVVAHQRRGSGLSHALVASSGYRISVVSGRRHDIQQFHVELRVGTVRCDRRAHRTGAQDGDLADRVCHAATSIS